MPSIPIREKVLENAKTTLSSIVAGESYFHTPSFVTRSAPNPASLPNDYTLFVFSPSDSAIIRDGRGTTSGVTETIIDIHVVVVASREVASDTFANEIAHDVEKALCADRNRGGFAFNFWPVGREILTDEAIEPLCYLTMKFQAHYRHDYANPSTQR